MMASRCGLAAKVTVIVLSLWALQATAQSPPSSPPAASPSTSSSTSVSTSATDSPAPSSSGSTSSPSVSSSTSSAAPSHSVSASGNNVTEDIPGFNKTFLSDYLGYMSAFSEERFHGNNCKPRINSLMDDATEYDKLGMSASTTLLTLIPTLLSFGNLFIPRASESFATSTLVGILSSAFGLGLPVKSIGGVPLEHTIDLATIATQDRDQIRAYGRALQGAFNVRDLPGLVTPLAELHGWYSSGHGVMVKDNILTRPWQFRNLKYKVHRTDLRKHYWYLPSITIATVQSILFGMVMVIGTFQSSAQPFWSCADFLTKKPDDSYDVAWATQWWLLVSGAVAVTIKFLQWETSRHELVKIHPLPGLSRLEDLVRDPNAETTSTHLPPTYQIFRPIRWLVHATLTLAARASFVLHNPLKAVYAEQSRRKPVVVLVHINGDARNPISTVLTGFVQSATLLILTFFFGSYWAGNLLDTLVTAVILLVAVTLGRLLGLVYVRWSSHAYGFTVIECYDKDEVRGVVRVLASMPDVMVQVNSAKYVWGVRVDDHPDFRRFLIDVERGQYDSVKFGSGIPISPHNSPPPSRSAAPAKNATSSTVNQLRTSDDDAATLPEESGALSPLSSVDSGAMHPPVRRATDGSATGSHHHAVQMDAVAHAHHTHTWPLTARHRGDNGDQR